MNYQLTVIAGIRQSQNFPLGNEPLVLGRGSKCNVVLLDPTISRRHCRVSLVEGKVYMEDLGSSNLTLVNGLPTQHAELNVGDTLAVGSCVLRLTEAPEPAGLWVDDEPVTPTQNWVGSRPFSINIAEVCHSLPDRPSTIQDLLFLHDCGAEFNTAHTMSDFWSLLQKHLVQRFNPSHMWLARVRDAADQPFYYTFEGLSTEKPPEDTVQEALKNNQGLLAVNIRRKDTSKPRAFSMVALAQAAGKTEGILIVQTQMPEVAYAENDLRLLMLLAKTAAPFFHTVEEMEQLRRDLSQLRARTGEVLTLVGKSDAIRHTRVQIAQAADSGLSVLISGESGTGKELAARLIHTQSKRSSGPFVPVNCAAIPAGLFESEFFGHLKGAFTGATQTKDGLFALSHGGTLFLDEIANLSMENQARILRAVELNAFRRVGEQHETQVNVRIVAASNVDLAEAVKRGEFREDLYHRLNGFEIVLPPLRRRPSDIPVLADYFLELSRAHSSHQVTGIAPEAMEYLMSQRWSGNVRELRHTILRAIHLASGPIIQRQDVQQGSPGVPLPEAPRPLLSLHEVEKQHMLQVLESCQGDVQAAARILNIGRSTLYRKISEYGIGL